MEEMSENEVIEWLEELFEAEPGSLTKESQRDDIEGWDSLGVLTLMADLDERFSIALSEEQLEAMTSIQSIIDILKNNHSV